MPNPQKAASPLIRSSALRAATPYSLGRLISKYDKILESRKTVTIAELLERNDVDLANAVALRFDVERRPEHALGLAQRLTKMGACSTMYFHTRKDCYNAGVMREIQELGHEVGFHHECLDRCRGDFPRARELFLRDIEKIRADSLNLRSVCSHGEVGIVKRGYSSNWELFERYPDLLTQAGLSGEVYIQLKKKFDMIYATDTFRGYPSFWQQIDKGLASQQLIQILVHPHRWHEITAQSLIESGKDIVRRYSNKLKKNRSYETPWGV